MSTPIRVLLLEDQPDDAELMIHGLRQAGFEPTWQVVDSRTDYLAHLDTEVDVILADYHLPQFNALEALSLLKVRGLDIPLIVITGTLGDEAAVECMKQGAADYLLKDRLARLGAAVRRALDEKRLRLERQRADQALRESEARFAGILDIAYEAIISVDDTYRIVLFNQGAQQIFGYAPDEAIGQPLDLLIPARFHPVHQSYVARFGQSGEVSRLTGRRTEIVGRRKTGEEFPAEASISKLELNGRPLFTVVLRDVTEQKRSAEALKASEKRFRALVEQSSDGIVLVNSEGTVLYHSPAVSRVLGYVPQDRLGQEGFAAIHHADREEARQLFGQLLLNPNERVSATLRFGHEDGTWRWLEGTASNLLTEPSVSAVVVNYRDVTDQRRAEEALRKSEERFRLLFEDAPVGIAIMRNGVALYVNRALLYGFGYEDESDITGGRLFEQITPQHFERIVERLRDSGETLPIMFETVGQRKDGSQFPIWIEIGVIELTDGQAQVAYVTDLTARKRLEEETLKAERLRVELEKEKELADLKDRFISMVSHEFRTPLTVIRMSGELMANYPTRFSEDRRLKFLQEMLAQVGYMVQLLDDVLAIGKARAGKIDFDPVPTDAKAFSQTILEELQLVDADKHRFTFIADGDLGRIPLDEHLLRHILVNLLSNAIKYSPAGTEVSCQVRREVDQVVFQVKDQGIGIPQADLAHLFEAFHRAKNAAKIQGTGLGLAIVKANVERHGGTITMESTENVGTTFTIRIPVVDNIVTD